MKLNKIIYTFISIVLIGVGFGFVVKTLSPNHYTFKNKTVSLFTQRGQVVLHADGKVIGERLYLHIDREYRTIPVDTTWFDARLNDMRQKPLVRATTNGDSSFGYIQFKQTKHKIPGYDWVIPLATLEFKITKENQ